MHLKRVILRLVVSVGVSIVAAVTVALVVTIADLYLVGHGYRSVQREVLTWPRAGVHLSPAGIVLLLSSFGAGVATWFLMRRAA